MDDQERLSRVRDLRARSFRPREVAMALGVSRNEADRLLRLVAREDASTAPEPRVVGCWVSPGWSQGLGVPADWPDSAVPDNAGSGAVLVLVAREHRRGKVSVSGYLVDVFCLGVKDVIGPRVLDDAEVRDFVRIYFGAFEAPPVAMPINMARELVWGAVGFARALGFEPHPDFGGVSGHLGAWDPAGAVQFGLDGKPYFVQGVRDDPTRILRTLESSVGPGNFHFIVAV